LQFSDREDIRCSKFQFQR